jgi:hypothetical protein
MRANRTPDGRLVVTIGNYSPCQMTFNPLVVGSIPIRPTKKVKGFRYFTESPFFLDIFKTLQIEQKTYG